MLDWVFGSKNKRGKGKRTGKPPNYEKAKITAAKGSVKERRALASNENAQPEILYYFATDESPEVRAEVAENVGTPLQADLILARDAYDEVRCQLAGKIGRLVPTLTPDESERLTEMALEVLEILARDHLPRVRAIISEELKRATNVPHPVVRRLADDLDAIVSAPIIEFSPLLSDIDLIEIIARGIKGRPLIAVSRRSNLAAPVVDAVVDTDDTEAVRSVLGNQTARIAEETLDKVVARAVDRPEWHDAIAHRDNLPVRTVLRIASFVSAVLMETLIERNKGNEDVVDKLRKTVRHRIDSGELSEGEVPFESATDRTKRMFEAGTLDEAALRNALEEKDNAFVRHGLSLMARVPLNTAAMMLNSGNGKTVTALAWKAGLSMDMAVTLQKRLCRIKSDRITEPGEDGGYPMSEDDIEWYTDQFFT